MSLKYFPEGPLRTQLADVNMADQRVVLGTVFPLSFRRKTKGELPMTWGGTRNFRARPALRPAPAVTRVMMRAAAAAVAGLVVTVAAAATPAFAVPHPGGTAASHVRAATGQRTATGQVSSGAPWAHIAAGDDHTCGIGTGGTLWCWGLNGSGELGTGSHASPDRPQQVMTPAPDGWVSVTAGGSQTCAIRTGGTLWCWGSNVFGELGIGNFISRIRPWQVTAPARGGWVSVTAGEFQTCATRSDGTAWCWGDDVYGELGIGGGPGQDRPRQLTTPAPGGWVSVTAGGFQACGIRTGGTLWCWGANFAGELGIGDNTSQDLPQQVTTPAPGGWDSVTSRGYETCATRTAGTVWCWGYNKYGELGLGGHTDQDRPRQVTAPAPGGWASVRVGDFQACGIRTGGTLWCWGYNGNGQLGIGSHTDQDLPQQVTTPAPGGWADVTSGDEQTCATRTGGSLWCWGDNEFGQLGIGCHTDQNRPHQVTSSVLGTVPRRTGPARIG